MDPILPHQSLSVSLAAPILVVLALAWFLWLACLIDALIRTHFRHATQLAWILVLLLALPPFGALLYLLLAPGSEKPEPAPPLTEEEKAKARRREAELQDRERRRLLGHHSEAG